MNYFVIFVSSGIATIEACFTHNQDAEKYVIQKNAEFKAKGLREPFGVLSRYTVCFIKSIDFKL